MSWTDAVIALSKTGVSLQHFSYEIRSDRRVAITAIQYNPAQIHYTPLRFDKGFVLEAVALNPRVYSYLTFSVRSDPDVAAAACAGDGALLQYAPEELKSDRRVVSAALNNNGLALQYAGEDLRSDKDTVLAAAANDGCSVKFASWYLRRDVDVAFTAVCQNVDAGEFCV
jgi:hypothetical protein